MSDAGSQGEQFWEKMWGEHHRTHEHDWIERANPLLVEVVEPLLREPRLTWAAVKAGTRSGWRSTGGR